MLQQGSMDGKTVVLIKDDLLKWWMLMDCVYTVYLTSLGWGEK